MDAREELYDVVGVGFGPASLSLAIGLQEQDSSPKTLFLEKSEGFRWRANDFPLGNGSMRTNFMEDLVTARNPLSKFTLVNYLWSTGMLVMYTNLSAINPPREVFDKYLNWCAKQIEELGWVQYGSNVKSILPAATNAQSVPIWRVVYEDASDETQCVLSRKVVIAAGSQPTLPDWASAHSSGQSLAHSSHFGRSLPQLQASKNKTLNVAVVGSNNEALEIFAICQKLPHIKTSLFVDEGLQDKLGALNPSKISSLSVKAVELQQASINNHQCSLPQSSIDKQYRKRYWETVREAKGKEMSSTIVQATKILSASKRGGQIVLEQFNNESQKLESSIPFNHVFVASGRRRYEHKRLLKQITHIVDIADGQLLVDDQHKVVLRAEASSNGSGIWVADGCNDCNEDAFADMALRTQGVLVSLTGEATQTPSSYKPVARKLVLESARL